MEILQLITFSNKLVYPICDRTKDFQVYLLSPRPLDQRIHLSRELKISLHEIIVNSYQLIYFFPCIAIASHILCINSLTNVLDDVCAHVCIAIDFNTTQSYACLKSNVLVKFVVFVFVKFVVFVSVEFVVCVGGICCVCVGGI